MRVSDYIFSRLKEYGVRHVFMLSGGGAMYLVDSLGRSGIDYICCHHEQAAAIAAQAYGMYNDELGVCLVTTGPGGTNALTGTAAAYTDSTPLLFISGQVKRSDFASLRGVRQFGAQENDIVSMANPVTKYAVTVKNAEDVSYELDKCIYIATHGRKGPVWLDIPLDIQSEEIYYQNDNNRFIPECGINNICSEEQIKETLKLLSKSKRPLLLTGYGMTASRAHKITRKFTDKTGIPVLSTWRTLDFMGSDDDSFFGSPGLQAPRYSNLIMQHCDFLLVLGSRLDNMITAFSEERFALMADVVAVDIDENELGKLKIANLYPVVSDVKVFMEQLNNAIDKIDLPDISEWKESCRRIRSKYPLLSERQTVQEGVNLYKVTDAIASLSCFDDNLVISSTSRCNTAGHIAFPRKRGQKSVSSMGMGSMGFALPSAVGIYFAGDKKKVIVLEGDGSLQLNIQELETIVSYKIDAKMFIFDNSGYAAITAMQDRNFNGFYVGSNAESGVFIPDMEKIAYAYNLPFRRIESEEEIVDVVRWALVETDGPCIVDIVGSLSFDEIPKCISWIDEETGHRVSAELENPFPFISKEEMDLNRRLLIGK